MIIKKGDTVKFLNDVGGGIVTRTLGDTIYVEDEDGFEVPVLKYEVVLINNTERAEDVSTSPDLIEDLYQYQEAGNDSEKQCFLAFLKGKEMGSGSGDFRLYLINDSNYFVFYNIGLKIKDNCESLYQGTIEPNTKEKLDTVSIQFFDGKEIVVQLIFYKVGKGYEVVPPADVSINFKSNQLLRSGSLLENDYFDEKAKLFPLLKGHYEAQLEELKKLAEGDVVLKDKERIKGSAKNAKRNKDELIEVDLHIHELLDDVRGLSNSEMLRIQMDKFHQVIEENVKNKGQRIVFIHGVGGGVLKQEVLKELKRKYSKLYYQDASFKEYGYGATMVII